MRLLPRTPSAQTPPASSRTTAMGNLAMASMAAAPPASVETAQDGGYISSDTSDTVRSSQTDSSTSTSSATSTRRHNDDTSAAHGRRDATAAGAGIPAARERRPLPPLVPPRISSAMRSHPMDPLGLRRSTPVVDNNANVQGVAAAAAGDYHDLYRGDVDSGDSEDEQPQQCVHRRVVADQSAMSSVSVPAQQQQRPDAPARLFDRRPRRTGERHRRRRLAQRRAAAAVDGPLQQLGCADRWQWSQRHRACEVEVRGPEQRTAFFHPNWSKGTAAVRGTRVLNNGRYYWEIHVTNRIFGTSMMFGIGTAAAKLHANTFTNLLGADQHSWGLSHKGIAWHAGVGRRFHVCFPENCATTVGLLFDGVAGTLTYYKDDECLGVAFRGLDKVQEQLYPIVCSTAAKTEMELADCRREFVSLQDRCRAEIVRHVRSDAALRQLQAELHMPPMIARYLELALPVDVTVPVVPAELAAHCAAHPR